MYSWQFQKIFPSPKMAAILNFRIFFLFLNFYFSPKLYISTYKGSNRKKKKNNKKNTKNTKMKFHTLTPATTLQKFT